MCHGLRLKHADRPDLECVWEEADAQLKAEKKQLKQAACEFADGIAALRKSIVLEHLVKLSSDPSLVFTLQVPTQEHDAHQAMHPGQSSSSSGAALEQCVLPLECLWRDDWRPNEGTKSLRAVS